MATPSIVIHRPAELPQRETPSVRSVSTPDLVGHGRSELSNVDLLGALTSGLCALHCVALGFGTSMLAASFGPLADPRLRLTAVCAAAFFASLALSARSFRVSAWTVALLLSGLSALVLGRIMELWARAPSAVTLGEITALTGGATLAFAHASLFIAQRRRSGSAGGHREPRADVSLGPPRWTRRIAQVLLWVSVAASILYVAQGPRSLPASAMSSAATQGEEGTVEIGWDLLAGLDIFTGEKSPELTEVLGKRVRIPGYIVPLDEDGTEFLLAPWVGACVHAATPPPNQMIHIVLEEGVPPIDPWGWDPLWVTGKLEIVDSESPWGQVSYFVRGDSTKIYVWEE